jgi:hypothetical protein
MTNLKPLVQQYIDLVGRIYPGQIPFSNPNYTKAGRLHDYIRSLEMADPDFTFAKQLSWQQHLDSVKETV